MWVVSFMLRAAVADRNSKIRGWLLVLCVALLLAHPLALGLSASRAIGALPLRGTPLALVLLLRLAVTAVGIAAGLALAARRAAAVPLAYVALVASAATDVFIYTTSYYPSNRFPGDDGYYIAATIAYHGAWICYLARSRRVRQTFP